jgi:hypothetical protein
VRKPAFPSEAPVHAVELPGNWHLNDVSVIAHASLHLWHPKKNLNVRTIIAIAPKSEEIGSGWGRETSFYFNFFILIFRAS